MLFIVFKNVHTHHQIPGYATDLFNFSTQNLDGSALDMFVYIHMQQ